MDTNARVKPTREQVRFFEGILRDAASWPVAKVLTIPGAGPITVGPVARRFREPARKHQAVIVASAPKPIQTQQSPAPAPAPIVAADTRSLAQEHAEEAQRLYPGKSEHDALKALYQGDPRRYATYRASQLPAVEVQSGSAADVAKSRAQALRATDPKLTEQEALREAFRQDPDLFSRYREAARTR